VRDVAITKKLSQLTRHVPSQMQFYSNKSEQTLTYFCRLSLITVSKARRTYWNKTEIKQNCRWSGLPFSRPSTVLFYFSFKMRVGLRMK